MNKEEEDGGQCMSCVHACHEAHMCVCQRDLRNYYYWFLSLRRGNVTRWLQDDRGTNLPFVHWLKEVNSCKFIYIPFNMTGSICLCFRKLTYLAVMLAHIIRQCLLCYFNFYLLLITKYYQHFCPWAASQMFMSRFRSSRIALPCAGSPAHSIQITATIQ